jgi:hypothetical protein
VADEPWQVRIALDPAEVEAIVAAMFAVAPRDRWGMSEPEDASCREGRVSVSARLV